MGSYIPNDIPAIVLQSQIETPLKIILLLFLDYT